MPGARPLPRAAAGALAGAALCLTLAGCGKTVAQEATRQLLTAESIDRAVAGVDLTPLAGRDVFLDTRFLESKKPDLMSAGTQSYLVSSLRHRLMAAGARLHENQEDAEWVVEARAGAVGTDAHEVVYGIRENNLLNAAGQFVPNAPPLPSVPEISLAKQSQSHAATKLRLFAYARADRRIVWQSGAAEADSRASHTWLLGAGPFERGDIYDGPRFAGEPLRFTPKWLRDDEGRPGPDPAAALADYDQARVYGLEPPPPAPPAPPDPAPAGETRLASAEEPAAEPADDPKPDGDD